MAKFNMSPNKNPMPTQDALERAKNFYEVAKIPKKAKN